MGKVKARKLGVRSFFCFLKGCRISGIDQLTFVNSLWFRPIETRYFVNCPKEFKEKRRNWSSRHASGR